MRLRIAALRRERGLSQADLANLVGSSQSAISRIESGLLRPNMQDLEEIAGVLGVTFLDLFYQERAESEVQITEIAGKMTEEQRRQLLDYARFLANQKTLAEK